jgi:hypothetical protein
MHNQQQGLNEIAWNLDVVTIKTGESSRLPSLFCQRSLQDCEVAVID